MTVFDPDYERARAEELFEEARMMTEIGMAGADRRDPRTADFLEAAVNQTNGDEDAFLAYIKKWWR